MFHAHTSRRVLLKIIIYLLQTKKNISTGKIKKKTEKYVPNWVGMPPIESLKPSFR
jgi:hypothetical protein